MPALEREAEEKDPKLEQRALQQHCCSRRKKRARSDCEERTTEAAGADPSISVSCAIGNNNCYNLGSSPLIDRRLSLSPGRSSLHLAGSDHRGGPNPANPAKENVALSLDSTATQRQRPQEAAAAATAEDEEASKVEEDEPFLDPATHSFTLALRECQNRRLRSKEAKEHRRPLSLDCDSQGSDAPISCIGVEDVVMNKSSAVLNRVCRSGVCPSSVAPNYRHGVGGGFQKGWSSESVPLPASSCRRNRSSVTLVPLGSGRALPSKWEDAEKWIGSPVSGDAVGLRHSAVPHHHRRPKSKSGPVGSPPAVGGSYVSTSPLVTGFHGGMVGNFAASSPFTTGVLMADRGCYGSASTGRGAAGGGGSGGGGRSPSTQSDHSMVRSASMHGWSDMMESASLPSSYDGKMDSLNNASTIISQVVSKKDVATQMSPEDSTHSSPSGMAQSPSAHAIAELQSHFSNLEVRDVQVDDRVTVTRWSKKHVARGLDKGSGSIIQWKKKTVESRAPAWEVTETAKCISKLKREEASITAWENLQNAKAEAEMRKLEMKLEKKRSSSMDRILKKLRSAQRKAQEMRNDVAATQAHPADTNIKKTASFRRTSQFGSLSGCFVCNAF